MVPNLLVGIGGSSQGIGPICSSQPWSHSCGSPHVALSQLLDPKAAYLRLSYCAAGSRPTYAFLLMLEAGLPTPLVLRLYSYAFLLLLLEAGSWHIGLQPNSFTSS